MSQNKALLRERQRQNPIMTMVLMIKICSAVGNVVTDAVQRIKG